MRPLSKTRQIITLSFLVFLLVVFILSFFLANKNPITIQRKASEVNATTLYSSLYLRNWPTVDGRYSQFSNIIVNNTSSTDGTLTISLIDSEGKDIKTMQKFIPKFGVWNSYMDADWSNTAANNPNGGTYGWVKVTGTIAITGLTRYTMRSGSNWDSPLAHLSDVPMLSKTSTKFYSSYYLKNWPGTGTLKQNSQVFFNNPNDSAATITVSVFGTDGARLRAFSKVIAPHALWNSGADADWLSVPNTPKGTVTDGSFGWVNIISDKPVLGGQRVTFRDSATTAGNIIYVNDYGLATEATTTLYGDLYVRNWPSGADSTDKQFSSPVVNNPSTSPASINVTIYGTDGQVLKAFTRQVGSFTMWTASGDTDWMNTPATNASNGTLGWFTVTSDQPIVGSNRLTFRNGTDWASPLTRVSDIQLSERTGQVMYSSVYSRNVAIAGSSSRQFTNIFLANPSGTLDSTATITIYNTYGTPLKTFTKTVVKHGWYNTYGDVDWQEIVDAKDRGTTLGWAVVTSSQPLIGATRLTLRTTSDWQGPLTYVNDYNMSYGAIIEAPTTVPPGPGRATFTPVPSGGVGSSCSSDAQCLPNSCVNGKCQVVNPTAVPTSGPGRATFTPAPADPTAVPTSTTNACRELGVMCGGIANLRCCDGLSCQVTSTNPDASGTCVSNSGGTTSNTIGLTLKLKLQAIERKPTRDSGDFTVVLSKSGTKLTQHATFTANDQGVWTNSTPLTFTGMTPGNGFAIFVKGPQHLQKKVCVQTPTEPKDAAGNPDALKYTCGDSQNITLAAGANNLDFSGIYMPVGDLPIGGHQDSVSDSLDMSYLIANDQSRDSGVLAIGDLNRDGVINVIDRNLLRFVLSRQLEETR